MKNFLISLVFLLGVLSCNNSNNLSDVSYAKKAEHPGKVLMEKNCNVCHSPSASHDSRLAPPMIAVKKHYINSETSKQEFIEATKAWVKNPNKQDAKMFGAVRRFGVMPKADYSEETIEQIADYIYDNDIEQPEWFQEHFESRKGKGKMN
ncbi:cytochrome c [Winogradskyella wandonensis]|uniref:Cytochrome c n=1 Tax=Winogradskyella wandonensis TaxID=1442586 RepID=A0A4R1KK20_9FLAO|nr:c-type cytochrome [Winogradskyella wandonensis]TCK65126.1 cytochrome c [Winogradskyella wandonensis]